MLLCLVGLEIYFFPASSKKNKKNNYKENLIISNIKKPIERIMPNRT